MEKSGSVHLTSVELQEFQATGKVPSSLADRWDLTANELSEIIRSRTYVILDKPHKVNSNE